MKLTLKKFAFALTCRKVFLLWIRHYKAFFTLLFFVISGIGGYHWYHSLYRYHWTEEQRRTYLESTVKETAFQEDKFQDVLKKVEDEAAQHIVEQTPGRDLFAGARKKEQ